ncbi:hypothetical protein [Gaiella sp.]|uniref:hypothetical protein n=1 Tax=Gaiella sp. TaxID=2663207 RepID=UPI0039831AC3
MLHVCTTEGCSTIVFGRGPCVEHEPRRLPLADQLLADAVAVAQQEQANAEAADPVELPSRE